VLILKNVMFGSHIYAITTVQCTANHVNVCTETTLNIYSKTLILQLCGDNSNGIKSRKIISGKHCSYGHLARIIQAHTITENMKCGNRRSAFYCNYS